MKTRLWAVVLALLLVAVPLVWSPGRAAVQGSTAVAVASNGSRTLGIVAETATVRPQLVLVGGTSAIGVGVEEQWRACAVSGVARLGGVDRYATAAAISRAHVAEHPDTVVVASGEGFADALVGGPVAADIDGPVLLTARDVLPDTTRVELERLGPERIVIVGGTSAVSGKIEQALAEHASRVGRLAGRDRFATAAAVARQTYPDGARTVVVATGLDWPDAVAAVPLAAVEDAPVLLVSRHEVPAATAAALDGLRPERIVLLGGTAAIDGAVEAELARRTGAAVDRLYGSDRYGTAATVAERLPDTAPTVYLATGQRFPDALAAGPVAGAIGAPVLFVAGPSLPAATTDEVARRGGHDCRHATLTLDPVEALAIGGGVSLTAIWPDGATRLDGAGPVGVLVEGAPTVRFGYPAPVHAPHHQVVWNQVLDSDGLVVRQPWRGQRPPGQRGIVLAWQAFSTSQRYVEQLDRTSGLTVTSPFAWRVSSTGQVTGGPDPWLHDRAHERGLQVWPAIASLDGDAIHRLLADDQGRRAAALRVAEEARASRADGVNIDLEGFPDEDRDAFTDFAATLADAVHAWGGHVSVDLTVMTDHWAMPPEPQYSFWSTAPDRRALSDIVDHVILMAYDEHNRLRPAGPVASPPWVEEAVRYQLRFTDPDRLILGIPFYGRVWDPDRLDRPRALDIGTIAELTAQGHRNPDAEHLVDRVDLADGRFLWAEVPDGLRHRTDLVAQLGLAGLGAWRLGFDNRHVWEVLQDR